MGGGFSFSLKYFYFISEIRFLRSYHLDPFPPTLVPLPPTYLSIHPPTPFTCLPNHPPTHLFTHLPIHPSSFPPITHPPIHPLTHLSPTRASVHLPIQTSIHPSLHKDTPFNHTLVWLRGPGAVGRLMARASPQ